MNQQMIMMMWIRIQPMNYLTMTSLTMMMIQKTKRTMIKNDVFGIY